MATLKNHHGFWLRDDAAAAFDAYEAKYGIRRVNSAGRTVADQQKLIDRWNRGGAANRPPHLYKPAMPATASNHVANGGVAVDIGDYDTFRQHCEEFGFRWYGASDPVHFTFVGRPNSGGARADEATRQRQAWLNQARGEKLAVDGIQGPATTAAIKRYQAFLGVAADGIWGPATQAAHAVYYAKVTAPAPSRILRRGSTGDLVRKLQETLKRNYSLYAGKLAVDGIYGPATEAAVREFQRRAGLAVDGIAGPATLGKLGI
ncbi:peptidoglycan-binding protein [Microbacterium sp. XT11]|uniref:peptidoglycan-binding protein n=1 Tax=Microbacterium sp. XT11 TaxID=367477 RepID=UPI0007431355|nr:peptidoglycan-binding protein [Microbacterium sp. XT11]ALX67277.1 putative N-acetylmuramoyl-L-alanine amidase [Microbacterium sp. XT11]